jgi:hypothetical protein
MRLLPAAGSCGAVEAKPAPVGSSASPPIPKACGCPARGSRKISPPANARPVLASRCGPAATVQQPPAPQAPGCVYAKPPATPPPCGTRAPCDFSVACACTQASRRGCASGCYRQSPAPPKPNWNPLPPGARVNPPAPPRPAASARPGSSSQSRFPARPGKAVRGSRSGTTRTAVA